MLLINCPHCGERAQTEFDYVRSLDSIVRLAMPADEALKTLFERANPRGVDDEIWRHSRGCRQFLNMRRNRVTHEIISMSEWGTP